MSKLIQVWTGMNQKFQVWTREGHQELTHEEWCNFDDSLLHRTDGPAVITPNGTELWYQNGLLHREDGPAVTNPNGAQWWYQNGQIHRDDGPARIFPNGTELWYLNGNRLPTNEVELWIKTNCIDLNRLEDQLMFLTEWG